MEIVPAASSTDLSVVPDDVIIREYRKRYQRLRQELGPYATVKKVRPCKGCGKKFSARDMRKHKCPSGLSWPKR